ncbi:MAG: hypothetical protein K0R99_4484 [Microbacterium sp.]|nr:hypothetical protein [Microbacterium sp.]
MWLSRRLGPVRKPPDAPGWVIEDARTILPVLISRAEDSVTSAAMPKEWVAVKEAALLVGRDEPQIYRWISGGRLATRNDGDGITQVLSSAVVRVESEVKGATTRKR